MVTYGDTRNLELSAQLSDGRGPPFLKDIQNLPAFILHYVARCASSGYVHIDFISPGGFVKQPSGLSDFLTKDVPTHIITEL